jgi:hypothetical protein
LQAQLAAESSNTEKHHLLMNNFEELARTVKEQQDKKLAGDQIMKISEDLLLNDYYQLFQLHLNGCILACLTCNSGMVAAEARNSVGTKAATVLDFLKNSVGGSIPGASLVFGVMSTAIRFREDWQQKRGMQRVARVFKGAAAAEKVAELVARKLTLALASQLQALDVPAEKRGFMKKQLERFKAAKRFIDVDDVNNPIREQADSHVKHILVALMGGDLTNEDDTQDGANGKGGAAVPTKVPVVLDAVARPEDVAEKLAWCIEGYQMVRDHARSDVLAACMLILLFPVSTTECALLVCAPWYVCIC